MSPFPVLAAALIQYAAITAPVYVPAASEAPQSVDRWTSRYADRVPAKPRSLAAMVSGGVGPLYVADVTVTAPTLSWRATYPDRIHRKTYPASQQRAHVEPVYPSWVPPPADPGGSFVSTGALPIIQYQAYAAPLFVPIADRAWAGSYPDRVWPSVRLHASRQQVTGQDRFAAPTPLTTPGLSWSARYPDRIPPRQGSHASRQLAFTTDRVVTPGAPPAPDLSWKPTLVDRNTYRRPQAPYIQVQPEFGFVVDVPVMSWTGRYLDPPTRRKSPRALYGPSLVAPFPADVVVPPAPDASWRGQYADRVDARPRSLAALESKSVAPIYLADVSVVAPDSSWSPRYPDRAPAPRRLITGAHQAFSFDRFASPDEVIAPSLAATVYPDRVFGRRPLVEAMAWAAPLDVPDVTDPVIALSWSPSYPEFARRAVLASAHQPAWFGPVFIPGVTQVAPDLVWVSRYPDRVWSKRSLRTGAQLAGVVDPQWSAPPPPFVPDLWTVIYPDRIHRPTVPAHGYLVGTLEPTLFIFITPTAKVRIRVRPDVGIIQVRPDPDVIDLQEG